MTEPFLSPSLLIPLFFCVAFCYSSVGLGGGSAYAALLTILGFGTLTTPMLALLLNLIVAAVGTLAFIRSSQVRAKLVWPFLVSSMPMAYLGGALKLSPESFYGLLLLALILVVVRIYLFEGTGIKAPLKQTTRTAVSLLCGLAIGFCAGSVGIGGGIFLVPLIVVLGLGTQKEAAACGASFVFLNSAAGLFSRVQYNSVDLTGCAPIVLAVLAGGVAGACLGAFRLSPRVMEKMLGGIAAVAILLIIKKIFFY